LRGKINRGERDDETKRGNKTTQSNSIHRNVSVD
jgi:hypothetical protein